MTTAFKAHASRRISIRNKALPENSNIFFVLLRKILGEVWSNKNNEKCSNKFPLFEEDADQRSPASKMKNEERLVL